MPAFRLVSPLCMLAVAAMIAMPGDPAAAGSSDDSGAVTSAQEAVVEAPTAADLIGTWQGTWSQASGSGTVEVIVSQTADGLATTHAFVDSGVTYHWRGSVEITGDKVVMRSISPPRVETYTLMRNGTTCRLKGRYTFDGQDWGSIEVEKPCS